MTASLYQPSRPEHTTTDVESTKDTIESIDHNYLKSLKNIHNVCLIINKPTEATLEQVPSPDTSGEFMSIFLEEAEETMRSTQSLVKRWQTASHNMQLIKELQREFDIARAR